MVFRRAVRLSGFRPLIDRIRVNDKALVVEVDGLPPPPSVRGIQCRGDYRAQCLHYLWVCEQHVLVVRRLPVARKVGGERQGIEQIQFGQSRDSLDIDCPDYVANIFRGYRPTEVDIVRAAFVRDIRGKESTARRRERKCDQVHWSKLSEKRAPEHDPRQRPGTIYL